MVYVFLYLASFGWCYFWDHLVVVCHSYRCIAQVNIAQVVILDCIPEIFFIAQNNIVDYGIC